MQKHNAVQKTQKLGISLKCAVQFQLRNQTEKMTVPETAILKEIIAVHLTLLTKCFAMVTLTPLEVSPHFTDSYQFSCVNST